MSEIKNIPIAKIETNKGQIDGLPKNPRFIKDYRFEQLKKSIEQAPEMLELRELIVFPNGDKFVAVCGNMRLRACKELGFNDVPCKVLPADTPTKKLREIAIKDNTPFGNDDMDILANEWDEGELVEWGMELPQWNTDEVTDYGEKNQEIDTDEFADKVEIKFQFEAEEWQFVNSELQKIDANKENALLKLLNYNPNE